MRIVKSVLALLLVVGLACAATNVYQCDPRGPDAWEERANRYQPPEEVMDAIGVKAGMVVAEVGAGRGRYVVRMAARVGVSGKVYANDIDEEKLEYLRKRCERDSINNVETILGKVDDPLLPEGTCDLVYLINTYHDLDEPVELMRNITSALKPGGLLVVIENDSEKSTSTHHRIEQQVLFGQLEEAGYEVVRVETFLEQDNINIFRPAPDVNNPQ
jgi:ubiquinone/menaquinone biosynthesis C-methylase UbiE